MNKNILFIFITGLLCLSPQFLSAQNIQSSILEWNSSSASDIETGSFATEVTKVVSSPTDITWYNADQTVRRTMPITSTVGSWTNINVNGSITYNVTSGQSSGIVQFWRTDGETKVRIHLIGEGEKVASELSIANVNIQ